MTTTPFPRDTQLTAIAIAYKNPDVTLIADSVFPRVPVGRQEFSYYSYPDAQSFTVPDTRIGEKSAFPRVELAGSKLTARTEDFGLEIPLTASDVSEAPTGVDPKAKATEQAMNLTLLDREIRVANLAFSAAQYPASNKDTLAGADQWSDITSDPLTAMLDGMDQCLIRPNTIVFGHEVWSALSAHPKLVKAAGSDTGEGRITRQRLAELLEVNEVLVGSSWFNTVKPNKTAALARAWGKAALAFFRDRTVTTAGGLTFGITAQFGSRIAGSKEVDMGLRGGTVVRAGESVKELILATRAAFFWDSAVA